jgi:hypothetical protein
MALSTLVMIAIFLVSVYILYSQYKYGPDYFLPAFMKPDKFNYLVPIRRTNVDSLDTTFDRTNLSTEEGSLKGSDEALNEIIADEEDVSFSINFDVKMVLRSRFRDISGLFGAKY